jgi:AmmeMemoRadiSam system protein A
MQIPPDERAQLLAIAREALAAWVNHAAPVSPPAGASERRAGAFVTLHARGELRGCIGHVEADRRLVDVVAECALSAASADPRFPPVTASELPLVQIEVSVLGPLEPVARIEEVEVGRHGLVVESGRRRGLLLPQVAREWGWDAATLVAQTCRKAGLHQDAWPSGGATLLRFEADVFAEDPPR